MKHKRSRYSGRGGCGGCGQMVGGYGFTFTKSEADLRREEKMKRAGESMIRGTKDFGSKIHSGTKSLGHKISSGTKSLGHKISSGTKSAFGSLKRSSRRSADAVKHQYQNWKDGRDIDAYYKNMAKSARLQKRMSDIRAKHPDIQGTGGGRRGWKRHSHSKRSSHRRRRWL